MQINNRALGRMPTSADSILNDLHKWAWIEDEVEAYKKDLLSMRKQVEDMEELGLKVGEEMSGKIEKLELQYMQQVDRLLDCRIRLNDFMSGLVEYDQMLIRKRFFELCTLEVISGLIGRTKTWVSLEIDRIVTSWDKGEYKPRRRYFKVK